MKIDVRKMLANTHQQIICDLKSCQCIWKTNYEMFLI